MEVSDQVRDRREFSDSLHDLGGFGPPLSRRMSTEHNPAASSRSPCRTVSKRICQRIWRGERPFHNSVHEVLLSWGSYLGGAHE